MIIFVSFVEIVAVPLGPVMVALLLLSVQRRVVGYHCHLHSLLILSLPAPDWLWRQ